VREPGSPGDLAVHHESEAALRLADDLAGIARGAGATVRRLSLRRTVPHLQLHVDLPSPSVGADEFFRAVRAIGDRATSRRS
jgi:hypothetical protein